MSAPSSSPTKQPAMLAEDLYKNASLHLKLGCGSDCPLLKPGYSFQLWHAAHAAAEKAGRRFDSTFNLSSQGIANIEPPRRVELIDGELHGNAFIWVSTNQNNDDGLQETLENAYREMSAIFLENQKGDFQPSFTPNLELLLWCAVCSRETKSLRNALKLNQHLKTPPCIAMSLLCAAIDGGFHEAIPVLLNRSKSGDPSRPLIALFRRFSANFFELLDHRQDAQMTAQGLVDIYKLILRHYGTENCLSKLNIDLLKSYQVISYLAMFDTSETINLVEALPSTLFQDEKHDGDESLLISTFFDAAQIQSSNILTGAVLPLLRCGATGSPDLLDFNPNSVVGFRFHAINTIGFIQQHEIAARLVLEMRPNSCQLNVPRLVETSEILHRNAPDQDPDGDVGRNRFVFNTFFQRYYPRSLQATCRSVILKRMPFGLKDRYDAIKRLNLPICLCDFLNFKDLDDLLFLDAD